MKLAKMPAHIEIPCISAKIFFQIASFPKGNLFPHVEYINMRKFNGKEVFRYGTQHWKFAAPAGIAGYH